MPKSGRRRFDSRAKKDGEQRSTPLRHASIKGCTLCLFQEMLLEELCCPRPCRCRAAYSPMAASRIDSKLATACPIASASQAKLRLAAKEMRCASFTARKARPALSIAAWSSVARTGIVPARTSIGTAGAPMIFGLDPPAGTMTPLDDAPDDAVATRSRATVTARSTSASSRFCRCCAVSSRCFWRFGFFGSSSSLGSV